MKNIEDSSECHVNPSTLAIAQIMKFNTFKRKRKTDVVENENVRLGTAIPGKPQLLHMWVTNPLDDLNSISPCDHEEADTRVILHAAQAYHHNHQTIMIRTVDTDVVVSP